MGVMRKLRRKSGGTQYKVEPLRRNKALPLRKMSEVLLDFAQPLLEDMEDNENDCFEAVLSFATICWNLSFLPENEQWVEIKNITGQLGKLDLLMRLEAGSWARALLERKKAFFANDKRMILNYKVLEEKDGQRLLVMSTPVKD